MSTHTRGDAEPSQKELFHRLQTLDDMIRASEEAEDRYRRIAERRRIPPVPDLRFEYSYLRSVRQYVQLERPTLPQRSEKGKEKAIPSKISERRDKAAPATAKGIRKKTPLFADSESEEEALEMDGEERNEPEESALVLHDEEDVEDDGRGGR